MGIYTNICSPTDPGGGEEKGKREKGKSERGEEKKGGKRKKKGKREKIGAKTPLNYPPSYLSGKIRISKISTAVAFAALSSLVFLS